VGRLQCALGQAGRVLRRPASVGQYGAIGPDPGPAARVTGTQQVEGDLQMRLGQRPVSQPVMHLGELVLDARRARLLSVDGRGGRLELGQRFPVTAQTVSTSPSATATSTGG
jgi:hypothetical protein